MNVLIIGMLDSVHLARWLKQFEGQQINFFILSSRKYRKIHVELKSLLLSRSSAKYQLISIFAQNFLSGYYDYLKYEVFNRMFFSLSRSNNLRKIIENYRFDYIHTMELQNAGYLLVNLPSSLLSNTKVIVTNWGSDIFHYHKFSNHLELIKKVLAIADFYSAECIRDYSLAKKYGFSGQELPCIPNAGGFNLWSTKTNFVVPSERNQIIIKGYGGIFGRADLPISLLKVILKNYPNLQIFIYSVTKDTYKLIKNLPRQLQSNIRISTVRKPLTHSQLISEFTRSRIYIGCSESDGISTSFLEALTTGAYPIQTDTSCASEWQMLGAVASIIKLDSEELYKVILTALNDNLLVDNAAKKNYDFSLKYLDYGIIQQQAFDFYKV